MAKKLSTMTQIGGDVPTNGARNEISMSEPYIARVQIEGITDLIFHRWNCEAVAEKAGSAKGSRAKKTDNIESYVYRDDKGDICLPGEYLRQSIILAAKFRQDPRSPRKSALDLFKAGVISLTLLASLGKSQWDFEHRCRVVVQRNGITRTRPAMKSGWIAKVDLQVSLPEYIAPALLQDVIASAGRLVGVGDNRPTYGRFMVTRFETE